MMFIIFSCCDNHDPNPSIYWGHCSLDVNGLVEDFNPRSYVYGDKFILHFDGYHKTDFIRYSLTIGNLAKKVYSTDSIESLDGQNQSEYAAFYTFLADGDVQGNVYEVLPNAPNQFEITEYDTTSNVMKGSFFFTFVVKPGFKNDFSTPDTLRIENGEFKAKL